MKTSPSPYFPPSSSYAHVTGKKGTLALQKSCHLNFNGEFEFGALENSHNPFFLQIDWISKIDQKKFPNGHLCQNGLIQNFRQCLCP